ncbi:MAG: UDP-N-acetylglucosamine 1-carboxyvinyltransferase, partial [Evtepia sp.]|nr:UDP-N-acetylglucosamine 1-carboxyvinyltransferase [Evtepia sp.]
IVAATYLSAVASAKGEAEVMGADVRTVAPVIAALTEAGCNIRSTKNRIWIRSKEPLRGIQPIYTAPHPGFPTDAQPMLMAALAGGIGNTAFIENIFTNRYSHVEGLCRMGASICVQGRHAEVEGNLFLRGAQLEAHDLRGGAALVIAALGAQGDSQISGLQYIDRGYENLDQELNQLGAQVVRIGTEEDRENNLLVEEPLVAVLAAGGE